jgi:disulfide bond formation protein DsbB
MLKLAANLCRYPSYWLLIFLFGVAMELIALYFQYQLGYGPCVLCVEIRAIVLAIIIIALIGVFSCTNRTMANLMNIALMGAGTFFYFKSEYLLLIERNLIDGSCGFKANFPQWMPLDKWLPSVFEPWEACGYTPMLWFNITMAEGLMYCAILIFSLGAVSLLLNAFLGKKKRTSNLFTD